MRPVFFRSPVRLFSAIVCVLCLAPAPGAVGQETINSASVGGRVTDPQNAVIPGALVVARQTATNVQVEAQSGGSITSEVSYLRSIDGRHIRRNGSLTVLGHRWPLMRADFNGFTGKWSIEQISFRADGFVWRLTASYANRWKSLRPLMMRMLRSFRLASSTAR